MAQGRGRKSAPKNPNATPPEVKVSIMPIAGYTFSNHFNIDYGDAYIGDGFTYGGALTFQLGKFNAFELKYTRQDADVSAFSSYYSIDETDTINCNYIFAGFQRILPVSEKIDLFAGLNLGMGVYASNYDRFSTFSKFAFGLEAGTKFNLSDKIGIKMAASLNMPVTDIGFGLWFGSGGSGAGVTAYVPFVQFGFLGGLIIRLK
jgi:hypothetical protein